MSQSVSKLLAETRLRRSRCGRPDPRHSSTRRAEWRRSPAPGPLTQLHIYVRVWARFYRSPEPASSRSGRAAPWLPSRSAAGRSLPTCWSVGTACGKAARAPAATIDGNAQPAPPKPRISAPAHRQSAVLSAPDAMPPNHAESAFSANRTASRISAISSLSLISRSFFDQPRRRQTTGSGASLPPAGCADQASWTPLPQPVG